MLALYIFSGLSAVYFVYTKLSSPIAKLPGPIHSIFTPAWLMIQEFSGSRRVYIHEMHLKYGPVVRLGPNEVSFASVDAMKEIYTSGGSGYDRTELYDLFKQFGTRTLFSTPPKGPHSQRKRILADRYANTNIMRPETLNGLQKRAGMFLENCLSTQGRDPDVYVYLHCFALDGASQHLFEPFGTNSLGDPADMEIMEEMSYHDSLKKNLAEYYVPRLAAVSGKINFRRPRFAPKANDYVLNTSKRSGAAEYSLITKLQSKASELEELSAPAECMDHLAAGIDTTGDGLCFLMHQLSTPESQEIQARLHKELIENPDVPFDQLPYLDAVVKEGLRCFPPIPMSFPRYVPTGGKTLDGYFIPEHTIVSCQPYTLHKDEKVFFEPLVFKPERWMDAEEEVERNRMFFAFSQGSRGCIGKHLAMAEMKILLREVYSQCRTTISGEMKGDMSMADQIISSRPRGQTCLLAFDRV